MIPLPLTAMMLSPSLLPVFSVHFLHPPPPPPGTVASVTPTDHHLCPMILQGWPCTYFLVFVFAHGCLLRLAIHLDTLGIFCNEVGKLESGRRIFLLGHPPVRLLIISVVYLHQQILASATTVPHFCFLHGFSLFPLVMVAKTLLYFQRGHQPEAPLKMAELFNCWRKIGKIIEWPEKITANGDFICQGTGQCCEGQCEHDENTKNLSTVAEVGRNWWKGGPDPRILLASEEDRNQ